MYESLQIVLQDALARASEGKGRERHATTAPFEHQPIVNDARICGLGGPAFQVRKKAREAIGLAARGQTLAAIDECLDVAVYAAAMVIVLREGLTPPDRAACAPALRLEVGQTYHNADGETVAIYASEVQPLGYVAYFDRSANGYRVDGSPLTAGVCALASLYGEA